MNLEKGHSDRGSNMIKGIDVGKIEDILMETKE